MTKSRPRRRPTRAQGAEPGPSVVETAEYVAAMSDELAHLSRSVGLDVVAYLLEMARFEAGLQARER